MNFLTRFGPAALLLGLFALLPEAANITPGPESLAVFIIDDLIMIGIMVAMAAVSMVASMMMPGPKIEDKAANTLGDFNFPTSLEDRVLPIVFGSTPLKAPNTIWYGDVREYAMDAAGATVGYRYYLGMDLALCYGELDAITEFKIADDYVFSYLEDMGPENNTSVPAGGYVAPPSGFRTIPVGLPELFGGNQKGGGMAGDLHVHYGNANATIDPYLIEQESKNAMVILDPDPETPGDEVSITQDQVVPAYHNMAHVVWAGGQLGESPTLGEWEFTVHRYPRQLNSVYSRVNVKDNTLQGDANPVNAIFEILTDPLWGLNVPLDDIDVEAFQDASARCFEDGLGYGAVIDGAKEAKTVIDDCLRIANGMVFEDENANLTIRLARETYDTSSGIELEYDGSPKFTSFASIGPNPDSSTELAFEFTDIDETQFIAACPTIAFNLTGYIEAGDYVRVFGPVGKKAGPYRVSGVGGTYLTLEYRPGYFSPADDTDQTFGDIEGTTPTTLSLGEGLALIQILDQSDISKVISADRQAWDETFNIIQVSYLDSEDNYKKAVTTGHDMGNMAIRDGRVAIKKINDPGIRSRVTAAAVTQTALREYSYPQTTISVEVGNGQSHLRPGDVVRVQLPDYGILDDYLRLTQVTLPSDVGGPITIEASRDIFVQANKEHIFYVPGSNDLRAQVNTQPTESDFLYVTGLTQFHDQLFSPSPNNLLRAWHVIGMPNSTTPEARASVLDSSAQVYNLKAQGRTTPQGILLGTVADFDWTEAEEKWQELYDEGEIAAGFEPWVALPQAAEKKYRQVSDTSVLATGQRGCEGPSMNPAMMSWSESTVTAGTDAYQQLLQKTTGSNRARVNGQMQFMDVSGGMGQVVGTNTEDAIKKYGFGLALIIPGWIQHEEGFVEGSEYLYEKYFEIIGFEHAEQRTAYATSAKSAPHGQPTAQDSNNMQIIGDDGDVPDHLVEDDNIAVLQEIKYLDVSRVYRGLLDSGIQMGNGGSRVLFLGLDDPMYDMVDFPLSGDVDYLIQTASGSGLLPIEVAAQEPRPVTQEEANRRNRPYPPRNVRFDNESGVEGQAASAWGYLNYNGGEYQSVEQERVENNMNVRWNYLLNSDVTDTATGYFDKSVGGTNLLQTVVSARIIPKGSATVNTEYSSQAQAFWKEGWRPTTPFGLRPGDETITTTHAMPDWTTITTGNGATSRTVNLATLEGWSDYSTNERVYVEVTLSSVFGSGDYAGYTSVGSQRFVVYTVAP
jgi:hypothetical protein